MREQLRDLWRRFMAHSLGDRALFLGIPALFTLLVVVWALLLTQSSEFGSREGPASSSPASPIESPALASARPQDPSAAELASAPSPSAGPPASTPTLQASPIAASTSTPAPNPARVVRVANTESLGANLRRAPSASSQRITVLPDGAELDLVGPDQVAEGRTWRHVQDEAGDRGWILSEFLVEEPVAGPRPTSTPSPPPLEITEIASPVARGQVATLTIKTRPGTRCEVRVLLFGPEYAPTKGLEPRTADPSGECSWSWTVPGDAYPGVWRYLVVVGSGDQRVFREVSVAIT